MKTSELLREIIESERERNVIGGFTAELGERIKVLYAEIDDRIPETLSESTIRPGSYVGLEVKKPTNAKVSDDPAYRKKIGDAIVASGGRVEELTTGVLAVLDEWGETQLWQPIETAPKDGTRLLAFVPDSPKAGSMKLYGEIEILRWKAHKNHWSTDSWDDGGYDADLRPTHWAPLPRGPHE